MELSLKDLLLLIPAWTGAIVAVLGLNAWRRQLHGREAYDLERRLLRATYRLRDALQAARSPIVLALAEADTPERSASERERAATAWQERWNPINGARRDLDAEIVEAQVLWGHDYAANFSSFFDLESRLFGAVLEHLDSVGPDPDHSVNTPERRIARRAILYRTGAASDEFSRDLAEAVANVEAQLRPRLRRPG